jgi:hypothetical protein
MIYTSFARSNGWGVLIWDNARAMLSARKSKTFHVSNGLCFIYKEKW